jgi:hypothetical protein
MSAAYADVERPQASRLRETNCPVFAHHAERHPRAEALAPCCREVRARVGCARFVEFLIWVSAPGSHSARVLHSRAI